MHYYPYALSLFRTPYWLPVLRNSLLLDACHCPFPVPIQILYAINFHRLYHWDTAHLLEDPSTCPMLFYFCSYVSPSGKLLCLLPPASHGPRISTSQCCLSFKTQFQSYFLQGRFFDHLSWKEPYLSLNFQRIAYGSDHIRLCITAVSAISQR